MPTATRTLTATTSLMRSASTTGTERLMRTPASSRSMTHLRSSPTRAGVIDMAKPLKKTARLSRAGTSTPACER